MNTVVIVGAGFSFDANRFRDAEATRYGDPYPLVRGLAQKCFPDQPPPDTEIELAFLTAQRRKDRKPIQALVHTIQSADHYIGNRIAPDTESTVHRFLDRFHGLTFISFNYDCLLELALYQRGEWTPFDGFGVNCEAEIDQSYIRACTPPAQSRVQVLHLHGSVYFFPLEFEVYHQPNTSFPLIRETTDAVFRFDPDALGDSFIPFRAGYSGLAYKHTEERIIVPVPDKSEALAQRFAKETYARALNVIDQADQFLSIGYDFAACDYSSFRPLLNRISRRRLALVLVNPSADAIAARLQNLYPLIQIHSVSKTFGDWVADDFTV